MRTADATPPTIAVLPRAPRNASPVPSLTSLYWKQQRGDYGDARYPGNCSGELIKDLLRYFTPRSICDPMTGSGTCRDVCAELGLLCFASDICFGFDACNPASFQNLPTFDFVWIYPPYWRQKVYSNDPHDLSTCPTLSAFLDRYARLIRNCGAALKAGGWLAILMGDYWDREEGFVPLTYHTKRLCFAAGFEQCCTDIIQFSHSVSSSGKTYRSSFIPALHDTCAIFQKEK